MAEQNHKYWLKHLYLKSSANSLQLQIGRISLEFTLHQTTKNIKIISCTIREKSNLLCEVHPK